MMPLFLLASLESAYLKGKLLATFDKILAKKFYDKVSDTLPDSLKLKLSNDVGLDGDSVALNLLRRGSKDPYVWKFVLYRLYVENSTNPHKIKEFIKENWDKIKDIPEVVSFVGEIYENLDDLDAASRMYRLALRKGGDYRTAHNLVVLLARRNECDSALEYFGDVKENPPEDAYERRRLYLALGMCYDRKRKVDKALHYYKMAYSLLKDTVVGFRIADLLARRKPSEALSFLAAMYEDVGFERPNLHWGYALIMQPGTLKINEGIREIAHYIAIRGDDPKGRNLLMHAFLRKGDTSIAIYHARRAYELVPEDDDYRLSLALLLSATENNPRKFGYLLRERDKNNPLGLWIFARFYRMRGEITRAAEYYSRLIKLDPYNISLAEESYRFFKSHGRLRMAAKIMRNLTQKYPDSLTFWFELGDTYALLEEADSVEATFSYFLKHYGFKLKDCERAAVLNNWAYSYALMGQRLNEAKDLVERAYSLCKLDQILDTKGWIYFLLGQGNRAERLVERAVEGVGENDPTLPEVYLHLLLIRCSSGEHKVNVRMLRQLGEAIDPKRRRFYEPYIRECLR
ncbi:MAG: hypothetical protein GXO39_02515 [Thermotogae bacterium]|nr:hypothetical protein [Thermotogota bacterium]